MTWGKKGCPKATSRTTSNPKASAQQEETINKMKRQLSKWRRYLQITSEKGLISEIYKELI